MKSCPRCHAEVAEGLSHCPQCGAALESPLSPERPPENAENLHVTLVKNPRALAARACPNCRETLPPDAAVCPRCGALTTIPPMGMVWTKSPWLDATLGLMIALVAGPFWWLFGVGLVVPLVLAISYRSRYPAFSRGLQFGLVVSTVLWLGIFLTCLRGFG